MKFEQFEKVLERLPRRAAVAFATRCARRILPSFGRRSLPFRNVELRVLEAAELFAAGRLPESDVSAALAELRVTLSNAGEQDSTYIAIEAIGRAATSSSFPAYAFATASAAREVADLWGNKRSGDATIQRAMAMDLEKLHALNSQDRKLLQESVDPRPTGVLGHLWPNGEPAWYRRARIAADAQSQQSPDLASAEIAALSLFFDLEEFSDAEIAEMLAMLSELYRDVGGDSLVIDGMMLLSPASLPEVA